jgi:hypothetical protein
MKIACAALHSHMWLAWLYHIFPHYLIKAGFSGKKVFNVKYVLSFSLQFSFETFLIPERTERDISVNVHKSSSTVTVIFTRN